MTRTLLALSVGALALLLSGSAAIATPAGPALLAPAPTGVAAVPTVTVPPATAAPGRASGAVAVTIPNLTDEVTAEGAAASYGLRRAACHQRTRSDDETTGALRACIAAIPADAPHP